MKKVLLIIVASSSIFSCTTQQGRMEYFKDNMDWHVGRPFYRDLEKVCKTEGNDCKKSENSILILTEISPYDSRCKVRWYIDTSEEGLYVHPYNGMEFMIDGIINDWEYVTKPELCELKTNWRGPW